MERKKYRGVNILSKTKTIEKTKNGLTGEVFVPGDKSVSHRSVMLSSLCDGTVHVKNFLNAQDCLSTVECFRNMGVEIENITENEIVVHGRGMHGLKEPASLLDAGDSGTLLRLALGLLSAQNFFSAFTGDAALHKRPMGRVTTPLSLMGARIFGREDNKKLPLAVLPAQGKLKGISYDMPVASAQVKSAILLAGLYADSPSSVKEIYTSRDHTERMLEAFGVKVETKGTTVTVYPPSEIKAPQGGVIEVPGDISSAAFWLVAASIIDGSRVTLKNVGINQTRTGIIDILKAMGADITLSNEHKSGGEEIADIEVRSAKLHGVDFGADIMPRLIDEIPIISVAALMAEGETHISGAGELRVKETDRLQAVVDQFNKLVPGAVEGTEDGLNIKGGGAFKKATCFSYDDHRIAMALSIAGAAGNGVEIENPDCVDISYPQFYETLRILSGGNE